MRIKGADQAAFGKPDIKILVNGHPAATCASLRPVEEVVVDAESVWTVSQTVLLEPAENTIAVVATNRAGRNDPAEASIKVVYRTVEQSRPLLDVLAIGVSKYKDPKINPLDYTVADAKDFADAIARRAKGLHREVRTSLLLDDQATTTACRTALGRLVQEDDHNRTVVIFLAAHGLLEKQGDYYLMTHDSTAADPFTTALPWSDLERTIMRLAGCRVLLFADTCHSAASESPLIRIVFMSARWPMRTKASSSSPLVRRGSAATNWPLSGMDFLQKPSSTHSTLSKVPPAAVPGGDLYLWDFKGRVSANMAPPSASTSCSPASRTSTPISPEWARTFPLFRFAD